MVKICGKDKDTGKDVCVNIRGKNLDASEVVELMFDQLNGNDRQFTKAISEHLKHEHRTLQQNYFRSISNVTNEYCDDGSGSDARNKGSKDYACKVKKIDVRFPTY